MQIPLFPLRTVLFPKARIPLQVFEPRYLDMIKQTMKLGQPFGVVRMCTGSEVVNAGVAETLDIEFVGCGATIVDFDPLAHNRLRVVIEGGKRFRVIETSVGPDQLVTAEVEWLPEQESYELPEYYADLVDVLKSLIKHPSIADLHFNTRYDCAVTVAYQLAAVLPFEADHKQELLELFNAEERLSLLSSILDDMDS